MGKTTAQVRKAPNPTGKGGFGEHPENRNDGGRIKNPLKEFQRQEFENMTQEQKRKYLADIDKYKRWTMAEGNPDTSTDITSDGKPLILPSILIDKNEDNA